MHKVSNSGELLAWVLGSDTGSGKDSIEAIAVVPVEATGQVTHKR
jgi:hypothetical protein